MPCNLCLNAKQCEDDGNCTLSSYMFDCLYDTDGAATLDTYRDSDCGDYNLQMSWDISDHVTISDNDDYAMFAICDHITLRSYPARRGQTGQNCIKDEHSGYYEYAVMDGCYDTLITPRRSAYVIIMYISSSYNIYKHYIYIET